MISIASPYTGFGDCVMGAIAAHSVSRHLDREVTLFNKQPSFTALWLGKNSQPFSSRPDERSIPSLGEIYQLDLVRTRVQTYIAEAVEDWKAVEVEMPVLKQSLPEATGSQVSIFPFASCDTRSYPEEKWRWIAGVLTDAGYQVSALVHPSRKLRIDWSGVDVIRGYKTMLEVASHIQKSDLVLGTDSGPAHIAGILRVPCVSVQTVFIPHAIHGHYSSVASVCGERECTFCHFKPHRGFVPGCHRHCENLASIEAQSIVDEAIKKLR